MKFREGHNKKGECYEYDHNERWNADLLQGLGAGQPVVFSTAGPFPRMPVKAKCSFSHRMAIDGGPRPAWPRPVQPALTGNDMDRYADDLAGSSKPSISNKSRWSLHWRWRSRALHRPPRHQPRRKGNPDRRGATVHAED